MGVGTFSKQPWISSRPKLSIGVSHMTYHNLSLHTDKYQINMMYAHWKNGTHNEKRVYNAFFRKNPFGNGFAVFAGLERIVHYLQNLKFEEEDIEYLQQQEEHYDPAFLEELRNFSFTGNLYAVKEGTVVFPNEPIIRVEARAFEAHLIETAILNFMNYQTLIATKAARIKQVAGDDLLFEFGTRRAQEADAAIWGARAAYIAGFHATSNLRAGKLFGIPTVGTHSHAWVQDHDTEEEAFEKFVSVFPNNAILLVDTYDTLRSGVPNAIKVAHKAKKEGKQVKGIRLDSGDLAYLSKQARKMLDEHGLQDVKISASNDLDEQVIMHVKLQGGKIDAWGIGTKLITASEDPALGGVYKLVAKEKNGMFHPVIKISEDPNKITTPGVLTFYRILDKTTGKSHGDYIAMVDETVPKEELKMFDPVHTYKQKIVKNFEAVEMLQPIFINGKLVYELPTIEEIRKYHQESLSQIWEETLRLLNPQEYYVDLSENVWKTKMNLIQKYRKETNDLE